MLILLLRVIIYVEILSMKLIESSGYVSAENTTQFHPLTALSAFSPSNLPHPTTSTCRREDSTARCISIRKCPEISPRSPVLALSLSPPRVRCSVSVRYMERSRATYLHVRFEVLPKRRANIPIYPFFLIYTCAPMPTETCSRAKPKVSFSRAQGRSGNDW